MSSPVEQIKQRLSVVDVVQSYIKLDKAGVNFRAKCPFHSEKTPSFFVSPSRDMWHCFGCSKSGDIFAFVMAMEGVEFVEALRILADRAGVRLKAENPQLRNERARIFDLLKDAVDFYKDELSKRKNVLDYLHQRGLKDSIIQSYCLGYASREDEGWRNLYEFLLTRGYSDEEIMKSGLVVESAKNKKYYDRFRGRVMFPICDFSGRPIAFSGRLFPEESDAGKYINSPQTILYDKSKILYGFDRAKTEIRKQDFCVLVEGQMDALMSHQAGVLNAAAVSGIGLTPYHLEYIGRLSKNLIVSFDSDDAGLAASGRGIDLALKQGFEVKVVALPFGKDPADVASKDQKAWQKSVADSRHIIDFYLNVLFEKNSDPRAFKLEVEKIVLPYLAFMQSEMDKSHWIKKIAGFLNIREEAIWEQLKKNTRMARPAIRNIDDVARAAPKSRRQLLEERLLGIAFWRGDVNIISKDICQIFSEKNRLLLDIFRSDDKTWEGENKNDYNRFVLEGEMRYSGMEDEALNMETAVLINEFEREDIKEKLNSKANEIRRLEEKSDQIGLKERLDEFNNLLRRFNQASKMKNEITKK